MSTDDPTRDERGPEPEARAVRALDEFLTSDMLTCALYIDDALAFESSFRGWSGTPGPHVVFGDM